ncbi:MAG: hypothetical protein BM556_06030 [Bacteriovorax sp. MedPE-SWde]|nr:MAG: hypothetical protein BM556_06030 [Bacteriovorax sp. MedPE-SWde]
MKLLIVEDEEILLEKYTKYLSDYYSEINNANTYHDAIKLISTNKYDVVLVDYNLPDGNGLDIIKANKSVNQSTIFVMITAYSKERLAIESLNLGVFRYLEKPLEKDSLIEAMKAALLESRNIITTESLTSQFLVKEHARKILKEEYFVTDREIEIVENILIHAKNKIVGNKLSLSDGTVRNHLSNIYQKLHIESKDELKQCILKLNNGEELS